MKPRLMPIAMAALWALLAACSPETADGPAGGQGAVRLGTVLGEQADDAAFERAQGARVFRFPEDHDAHPDYRSEWWYLTLVLADATGREFGVQFTLFRQALRRPLPAAVTNPWQLDQAWLAHFAVADVGAGEHEAFERWSRGHPQLAGVAATGTGVTAFLDDWALDLAGDGGHLRAASEQWQVDIALTSQQGVVLQGEAGLSRKSEGQASWYYSWPRLAAGGTITRGGETFVVTGLGWFDHEWSTSVLAGGQEGWDWFALHLDDGRSIMAFRLRRTDGARDRFDHGVVATPDGRYAALEPGDFQLTPMRMWTDPDGLRWPVDWTLQLGDERLQVRAPMDDQRMLTRIPYWEGLVHVLDATGERTGSGYMELTGY